MAGSGSAEPGGQQMSIMRSMFGNCSGMASWRLGTHAAGSGRSTAGKSLLSVSDRPVRRLSFPVEAGGEGENGRVWNAP